MGCRAAATLARTCRAEALPADRGKASRTNLCNRLVFTSTRRNLHSRASGLAPFDPPFGPCPSARTLVRVLEQHRPRRRWIAARASPASRDDAVGAACTRVPITRLPVRAAPNPTWIGTLTCARLFRPPHKPSDPDTDASCRTGLLGPGITPSAPTGTEDPFHRWHTNATAFQARSAFRRWVPPDQLLAGAES